MGLSHIHLAVRILTNFKPALILIKKLITKQKPLRYREMIVSYRKSIKTYHVHYAQLVGRRTDRSVVIHYVCIALYNSIATYSTVKYISSQNSYYYIYTTQPQQARLSNLVHAKWRPLRPILGRPRLCSAQAGRLQAPPSLVFSFFSVKAQCVMQQH